jgi:hypothetical protein
MTSFPLATTLATALALASIFAPDEDATLGGFICARPPTPACATTLNAQASSADLAACRSQLESYAAAMTAYRDCLGAQMGDAMRHANAVLDHFRCVVTPKSCPRSKPGP